MAEYRSFDELPLSFGPSIVAEVMGISRTKAYALVNRQDFPKMRVGTKIIIVKSHFIQWLDEQMAKENAEEP